MRGGNGLRFFLLDYSVGGVRGTIELMLKINFSYQFINGNFKNFGKNPKRG